MKEIMDGSSVSQEDPPATLPLKCVLKKNESSLEWPDFSDKIGTSQNSKLLFLTVEYVQDLGGNEVEFNNFSSSISESEKISPFDPTMNNSERFSPLYNTLVIPANGQSQFQNSVVVLPTSRNNSQQISIVVDESQVSQQLIVEEEKNFESQEVSGNVKLDSEASMIIDHHSNFVAQISCDQNSSVLNQKLIITASPGIIVPQNDSSSAIEHNSVLLDPHTPFFQDDSEKMVTSSDFVSSCSEVIPDQFSSQTPNETVLLNESEERQNKTLLNSSKYEMNEKNLKEDELLLSHADQNNDLLNKPENLIEVETYNLTQNSYITSETDNSYPTVEEELSINSMEKVDNEYLLPDAMAFEDTDSNLLQSNLEVFTSQVLDNNGLLLYDKSRLRQNKKLYVEHLGCDYWCEDCEFGMKCGRHEVKIISDKPVLSRARATLPKELLAINKLNGVTTEEGVFARKTIMRRVQFGPVEGRLMKEWDKQKETKDNIVELLLEVETGHLLKLDVSDENNSNWMRFVRKAKTLKEQNLILTQQGKSLYFTTTRVIPPRQELKVGYSPQYAGRRKLEILEDLSWSCFDCTSRFSTSEELQKHLNIHENDKNLNDKSKKKKSKNALLKGDGMDWPGRKGNLKSRSQNEKNGVGKENECFNCHKTFPRTYSLKRHLMLVHSEKNKENSGIVKAVADKNDKVAITNTLFKKKSSAGTGSEWFCTHCNLTFDNPSVLNLHTLTHAAEDLESEAVLGLPSELSSVYHDGEFLIENGDVQCPQCTQEFPSKRELIDHVSTHGKMTLKKCCPNSVKPYKCDQCYKSFATDIRLKKHMLVHGSEETKPYQCEICFKRFLNNSALSCHFKTHNDKKCFECLLCKKEFEQVLSLKEHVKVHSINGCFNCPHCSRAFDSYNVIRKHIRAFHSGHQHVCKDCGKLCPTLDKLRMHSLKHSDHREFLCANCGKQFKRKDKLKEHMKRMHSVEREMKLMSMALRIPNTKGRRFTPKMSPLAYDRFIYKCRNCMVGFKRRGMLVNHLAKRHPDIVPDTVPELNLPILKTTRDYFCQYCDKIYKSSSKRKAHILKNHPGAELPMSNRQKGGIPHIPGVPNPTFSKTVGSVKTNPHGCKWCHKQYASKAKLLQHQRKKHISLLPQSQQVPRPSKNPSSPVGGKIAENPSTPPQTEKWKGNKDAENVVEEICPKGSDITEEQIVQGVFNINSELERDLDTAFKEKNLKGLPEHISCELLQQAMTELSQSFSDYKLPFSGTQENLLKIICLKDGEEGVLREDNIPAAQMTRTWPDLPPYPPR